MTLHRYILEPLPELELDKKRRRVKTCPCGKSNKDGKFVPYVGFEDRGYCHSCGTGFSAAAHTCPDCHKPKAFSRYIDTENGNAYLNDETGKCLYCTCHHTPKEYFSVNNIESQKPTATARPQPQHRVKEPEKPASTITPEIFKKSLTGYSSNHFVTYLLNLLGMETANQLISLYHIGTSKHWDGATVFWQVDSTGKIRTGKIMLYSPTAGKRDKEPGKRPTWVHTALKLPDFNLKQCFFGEHLLKGTGKPVAIVESEKTAIIASAYLPAFNWIATGGKTNLNIEKCQVLQGRKVILYPDLNAFDAWCTKAQELKGIAAFTVSDLLERKATDSERAQGLDLADYLKGLISKSLDYQVAPKQPARIYPHRNRQKVKKVKKVKP